MFCGGKRRMNVGGIFLLIWRDQIDRIFFLGPWNTWEDQLIRKKLFISSEIKRLGISFGLTFFLCV